MKTIQQFRALRISVQTYHYGDDVSIEVHDNYAVSIIGLNAIEHPSFEDAEKYVYTWWSAQPENN